MAAQAIERLYRLKVDASQANRQLKKISHNTNKIAGGFGAIQRAATTAFSVLGAARGLTGLTRASDQLQLLEGSFEALTESSARAGDMMTRVFRTVADTGASLKDTSSTFQRLIIGFQDLGGTNDQVDRVANTFIKLGRISGTAMFDTNAALIQFSQGLAAGRLQGDELRSIIERLPLITRLIADEFSRVNGGIKIARGQVKQLGRDGKITADIMGNALLRASDDIAEKFSHLVFTLEQELNSLGSTYTQVLAHISEKTVIGDTLKAGVRVANQALKDFSRNLNPFVEDMNTLLETSMVARGVLGSMATIIGIPLVAAIYKAGAAMKALALSNPFTAFALLATTAVLLIIKNWDKLKPFFLYQVPAWFFTLQSKWYEFMGNMEVAMKRTWRNVAQATVGGINDMITVINTAQIKLAKLGFPTIGLIDTIEVNQAGEAISSFGDDATEALEKAHLSAVEYAVAMSKVGKAASAAEDELKLFGKGAGLGTAEQDALDALNKKLEKLRLKVLNTINPLHELQLSMENLKILVKRGLLTDEDVAAYIAIMDGTTKAAEQAAAAARSADEEWIKFGISVKEAVDPIQSVLREFTKIDLAVEKGLFSHDFGERYKNMLLDMHEAAESGTDKIIGSLERIKDATDGFARDFTNTLVDGLKTGELAFDDFAASVLETMAKIVLNSIFEKFFAMVTGAIIDGIGGGGTVTPSYGGGVTSFTPTSSGLLSSTKGLTPTVPTSSGVKVIVNNNTTAEVTPVARKGVDGGIDIDILVEQKVNKSIANGGLDKTMQASFGISRRGL